MKQTEKQTGKAGPRSVGFLRCTCEKYPKVLEAGGSMLGFLGMTENSEDWRDLICNNVFFMLPFEDRVVFRNSLERAIHTKQAVSLEHRVVHNSGGYTPLIGWIELVEEQGGPELHLSYIRSPEKDKSLREQAYQLALGSVYDLILMIDRAQGSVECIHQNPDVRIPNLHSLQITTDSFVKHDIFQCICEEDRGWMIELFRKLSQMDETSLEQRKECFAFRLDQKMQHRLCEMLAVELDAKTVLICTRKQDAVPTSMVEQRAQKEPKVTIRTFGFFDILVNGKPIVFHYEKSKELLAVLVDRQGSYISNPYIINCLWEDEPYSEKLQNRCRQTVHRLMQTLKEYDIEDIIERVDGKRRIVPEYVQCDYFDYLRGEPKAVESFSGSYMSDYSWGEITLSDLIKRQNLSYKRNKEMD